MKRSHRKAGSKTGFAGSWVAALLLIGVVGVGILVAGYNKISKPLASDEDADVVVYKRASCNCCNLWVEHLRTNGLRVSVKNVDDTGPIQTHFGVPQELRSCHTAQVGDYWVEGHVPADLVLKLLKEKPNSVRGLAVPGMPIGSPGMEGPNPVSYSVVSVDAAGKADVYARREGASAP